MGLGILNSRDVDRAVKSTRSSKTNTINDELKEASNWFKANKLSVNASKTNHMILGTPHNYDVKENK